MNFNHTLKIRLESSFVCLFCFNFRSQVITINQDLNKSLIYNFISKEKWRSQIKWSCWAALYKSFHLRSRFPELPEANFETPFCKCFVNESDNLCVSVATLSRAGWVPSTLECLRQKPDDGGLRKSRPDYVSTRKKLKPVINYIGLAYLKIVLLVRCTIILFFSEFCWLE